MNITLLSRLLALLMIAASPAFASSVVYPVPGHLDAAEGTIEFWLRLEVKADVKSMPYFPLFNICKTGEEGERLRFYYQTIWNEHFHFFLWSRGSVNGTMVGNPYQVVTIEDTVLTSKSDTSAGRATRIPRVQPGDWHHIAITWKGLPQSTVALYLDGALVSGPVELPTPLWEGIDDFVFQLLSNPYQDAHTLDELRISCVVRSPEEIRQSVASVRAQADINTLLLDHFEEIREVNGQWQTVPEVFTLGYEVQGGLINQRNMVELIEGKSGKGLRLLRHYK
jgi:hypothetical protein